MLKENERIDDLQIKNLKIIQNTKKFCFGIDAVLLSNFAAQDLESKAHILDLGTGTGIIPLLIWGKITPKKIDGLEIQRDMVEMAKRSIVLNKLDEQIKIIEGDIKNPPAELEPNSYDAITTNPPYMINDKGLKNPTQSKAIARHEILCTLEDIIKTAKRLLKSNGRFYMIHRPQRLVDILSLMRDNKIEAKTIRFIHPSKDKAPNLVMIQGTKGGNPHVNIQAPLYVYQENGDYTEEIIDIYQWEKNKSHKGENQDE